MHIANYHADHAWGAARLVSSHALVSTQLQQLCFFACTSKQIYRRQQYARGQVCSKTRLRLSRRTGAGYSRRSGSGREPELNRKLKERSEAFLCLPLGGGAGPSSPAAVVSSEGPTPVHLESAPSPSQVWKPRTETAALGSLERYALAVAARVSSFCAQEEASRDLVQFACSPLTVLLRHAATSVGV